jgi:large subunit ribosomal protein L15
MISSKRKRIVKKRGTRECGKGGIKQGGRGGKGYSGSKKHRKSWIIRYEPDHIGKRGFKNKRKVKMKTINLGDIGKFVEKGKKELNLGDFGYNKVLGRGTISVPLTVKAYMFSRGAQEKIEKAGGKAIAEYEPPEVVEKAKPAVAAKKPEKEEEEPEEESEDE